MGDSLLKPVLDWMNTWGLRSEDKGSDRAECAADEQHGIHRRQQLDHKSFTVRDSESDVLNQPLALPANSKCSVSYGFRDFLLEGHFCLSIYHNEDDRRQAWEGQQHPFSMSHVFHVPETSWTSPIVIYVQVMCWDLGLPVISSSWASPQSLCYY